MGLDGEPLRINRTHCSAKAPDTIKRRFGNLVLLPPRLHATLQDKDPKGKVKDYRGTGLLIAGEGADLIEKRHKWNAEAVKQRRDALLSWAQEEWAD